MPSVHNRGRSYLVRKFSTMSKAHMELLCSQLKYCIVLYCKFI